MLNDHNSKYIYDSLFANLYKLHSLVITVSTILGSVGGGAVM